MIIPVNISPEDWAGSLIIDFPDDNIPILSHGANWKGWGDLLVQEESFIENSAPPTSGYADWQTWAYAVYLCMADN